MVFSLLNYVNQEYPYTHLNNIITFIHALESELAYISYEDFAEDDRRKLSVYKALLLIGLEATELKNTSFFDDPSLHLLTLSCLRNANYLHQFGEETFLLYQFIKNDLPYLRTGLHNFLQKCMVPA